MNVKWFGKANQEIQDASGKRRLFPMSRLHSGPGASEDTDPGRSPETGSPHHSCTPLLKHTIIFSVTLWSLLRHSPLFATCSAGCFTGKAGCAASTVHALLVLPGAFLRLSHGSSMTDGLTGDVRKERAEHPPLQKHPGVKPNAHKIQFCLAAHPKT